MHADQVLGIISTVILKPGREDEYRRALLEVIADHSTREPDCIDITVHRGVDDPARLMLYERWRITRDRFLAEQWPKPFITEFTKRTRDLVVADEDVTYWSATESVADGERLELAGSTP